MTHKKFLRGERTTLNPNRTVSEYCSARVSRVGLSTKQATEPYSDNLLNRTRNLSEPYSDKEIPLRRALRRFAFLVGLSTGNPPKIGTFTAWNRTRNRTRTPSDLRRENQYLYFGRFFPCTPGPFSCSTGLFVYHSHRAGPVLQEFGLVLRVGVRHSTSVLRPLPWG